MDAALDLSHTQNIGYVLKNHFAKSQFLVVSLKEGLFNNANVIYRYVAALPLGNCARWPLSADKLMLWC